MAEVRLVIPESRELCMVLIESPEQILTNDSIVSILRSIADKIVEQTQEAKDAETKVPQESPVGVPPSEVVKEDASPDDEVYCGVV